MAEQRQKSEIEMEKQHQKVTAEMTKSLLNASIQTEKLGMWFGFVLALVMMVSGTLVILSGFDVAGFGLIAAPAITIAAVYFHDRRGSRNEPQTKPEASQKSSSPPKLPDG